MTGIAAGSAADRRFYEQDHMWGGELTARERRRLADTVARLPASASFADIGAGDGRLVRVAAQAGRAFDLTIVVERSWAAVSLAPGSRVVGDAAAIPLRDQGIDTVSLCEVVEHLPVDVYEATLREAARVARSHLVLTVPNHEDLSRGMVACPGCGCRFHRHRHLRSFDVASLATLFNGFVLAEVAEVGEPELVVPKRLVALGRRLGVVPPAGGLPLCPQCGHQPEPVVRPSSPARPTRRGRAQGLVGAVASRAPKALRKAPWLLAVYRRLP